MPKRTNLFQQVIHVVYSHLNEDAKVDESAKLPDKVTGQLREVDTTITKTIGGYPLIVSIECRGYDSKKKASNRGDRLHGVEFIDQMHGKHQRLPTHILILVSEKGFTATAAPHAAACSRPDVKLVWPESNVAEVSDDVSASLVSAAFRFFRGLPQQVTVRCALPDGETAEGVIPTDIPIFDANGSVLMDGQEFVSNLIEGFAAQIGATLLKSTGDKKKLTFDIDITESYVNETKAPLELYIKTVDDDRLRRIVHVSIENHLTVEEVPLEQRTLTDLTAADDSNRDVARYAYGTTTFGGEKVTFVFTEGPDGTQQSGYIIDPGKN